MFTFIINISVNQHITDSKDGIPCNLSNIIYRFKAKSLSDAKTAILTDEFNAEIKNWLGVDIPIEINDTTIKYLVNLSTYKPKVFLNNSNKIWDYDFLEKGYNSNDYFAIDTNSNKGLLLYSNEKEIVVKEKMRRKLNEIITDEEELKRYMNLEKERLGLKDKLVFVGINDVASYYMCPIKSYFEHKKMELAMFSSYFYDRVNWAIEFNLIKDIIDEDELLRVGDLIDFEQINSIIEKRREGLKCFDVLNEYPNTTNETNNSVENIESNDPLIQGEYLESKIARKLPQIRWNFRWRDYIVVGIPDGIGLDYAYEFKTGGNSYLIDCYKNFAITQANLYGYFFKKERILVDFYDKSTEQIKTITQNTDKEKAMFDLEQFSLLFNKDKKYLEGLLPFYFWLCKKCNYKEECLDLKKNNQ